MYIALIIFSVLWSIKLQFILLSVLTLLILCLSYHHSETGLLPLQIRPTHGNYALYIS